MRKAAVIAAWIAVLAVLVWQSRGHDIGGLLSGAVAASIAAGVAIGSWWATAAPLTAGGVTFLVAYLAVPECQGNCEFGRVGYVVLLLFFGVPLTTAAMAAGVAARRVMRRLSEDDQAPSDRTPPEP